MSFTNKVVGPYEMSRPKLAYANVDGLLVPEALQLVIDDGVDFSEFDSLGAGIVDSVCIMYAGQTEYRGDLWPHNWVHRKTAKARTELYIVTSMGRRPQDLSIGASCHESGHLLFRWLDLYDYRLAEREGDDIKSSGICTCCVMGARNHLHNGKTPAAVSAYMRGLVGVVRDGQPPLARHWPATGCPTRGRARTAAQGSSDSARSSVPRVALDRRA